MTKQMTVALFLATTSHGLYPVHERYFLEVCLNGQKLTCICTQKQIFKKHKQLFDILKNKKLEKDDLQKLQENNSYMKATLIKTILNKKPYLYE